MITRVPVSISMGTRGTRELLMSLLVEALIRELEVDIYADMSADRK